MARPMRAPPPLRSLPILVLTASLAAQWSPNPAQNLAVHIKDGGLSGGEGKLGFIEMDAARIVSR